MDTKETGIIVVFLGTVFLGLGFVLLMDLALMAAGNLLIVIGLVLIANTSFFNIFVVKNLQGLLAFAVGILSLFYGFVTLGFLLELSGLYIILYDKIPSIKTILRSTATKIIRNIY